MGNTKHGTTRTMFGLSAQTSSHSPFLLCLALVRAMQYIAPANIATTMSTTNTCKRIPFGDLSEFGRRAWGEYQLKSFPGRKCILYHSGDNRFREIVSGAIIIVSGP